MSELRSGRPEAALAIWDWRAAVAETPSAEPEGHGRRRGVLQALVGGVAASLLYVFVSPVAASIVGCVAAIILLAALFSPSGLYAAIDRGFAAAGRLLGTALSWILLPAVFYLVFWPLGALLRRGRRDTMQRFYEPDAPTYWSARERGRTASESRTSKF